jgi:hypothetical protein
MIDPKVFCLKVWKMAIGSFQSLILSPQSNAQHSPIFHSLRTNP